MNFEYFIDFLFVLFLKTYTIYWTLINKLRYKWNYLLNFSGNYIYRDDRQPTPYNRICNECLDQSIKNYIMIMSIEILSFIGAVLGPFYAFIQNGSRATMYSVRLPFLQDNPSTEFIINVCWEMFISSMGIVALFGMEMMFLLMNETITVSSKLCELELDELSDQLESNRATKKQSTQKLRMILMKIKFMDEWDWFPQFKLNRSSTFNIQNDKPVSSFPGASSKKQNVCLRIVSVSLEPYAAEYWVCEADYFFSILSLMKFEKSKFGFFLFRIWFLSVELRLGRNWNKIFEKKIYSFFQCNFPTDL